MSNRARRFCLSVAVTSLTAVGGEAATRAAEQPKSYLEGAIVVCHTNDGLTVTVVPPSSGNQHLVMADEDGVFQTLIAPYVGSGLVEIAGRGGTDRHKFVQTREGSSGSSLVGFFVDVGGDLTALRIETWTEGWPLTMFDMRFGETTRGTCG